MKQEELDQLIYAQGWIEGQMESLSPENQGEQDLYGQWKEMWVALSQGIDQLVKESFERQEMADKLAAIKRLAGRNALEEKLEGINSILDT